MKQLGYCLLVISVTCAGCPSPQGHQSQNVTVGNSADNMANVEQDNSTPAATTENSTADAAAHSTAENSPSERNIALTSDNTEIRFVGTHAGDKPDPRTGTFTTFSGNLKIDSGQLQSISVEIDATSLSTDIEKLTNHLRSPDFFDVLQHPKATFQSTSIQMAGDGQVTVIGDLTLLGKTHSITFPATVSIDDGVVLKSEFSIDRTQFGMDYGTDKVEKQVTLSVSVREIVCMPLSVMDVRISCLCNSPSPSGSSRWFYVC